MTTFTLQDLTPQPTEEKTMQEIFTQMGKDLANHELAHQQAQQNLLASAPQAPEPQPTLTDIVNNICTQLQLLTTVLSQSQAQPDGENSLQECVSLTLQQADWFKGLVRETIVNEVSLEDVVKDVVKDEIESEVESYFSNSFDPTYHFDFNDAVSSEVSDQLDDVVRDRLDEVVQEQLEEVVAEKLKSIRVVFD
jgi:hypothetical protein